MTAVLLRIGKANQVADGEMRVFDLEGTKVNVIQDPGCQQPIGHPCRIHAQNGAKS